MRRGGKRPGAGAKQGDIRPKITSYWKEEDIEDYFVWLKKSYKKSDTLAKFVGEQIMGKAIQPMEGDFTGSLTLNFDKTFNAPKSPS